MSRQLSTEGFLKMFTFGPITPHFGPKMANFGHFWVKMGDNRAKSENFQKSLCRELTTHKSYLCSKFGVKITFLALEN